MAKILALDPGTTQSAWLLYDTKTCKPVEFGIEANEVVRNVCKATIEAEHMAIEMVAHYGRGMPVGKTVFQTCVWIGRFIESWGSGWTYVMRRQVKIYLCGSMRATDANVRQALLDRYGSERAIAVGTKKEPGPLYGIKKDLWSALAIAVTYAHSGKNYGDFDYSSKETE